MNKLTKVSGLDNGDRVESGPIQFGDDWPGIFIRGDHSLMMANALENALKHIPEAEWAIKSMLAGLVDTLRECSVGDTEWPPSIMKKE